MALAKSKIVAEKVYSGICETPFTLSIDDLNGGQPISFRVGDRVELSGMLLEKYWDSIGSVSLVEQYTEGSE